MVGVLRFARPREVEVVQPPPEPLRPGTVRVRTIVSGISAGTELTAYRGTNPYLNATWDPRLRLFRERGDAPPGYPLDGWGYSEVGEVVEVADDVAEAAARAGRVPGEPAPDGLAGRAAGAQATGGGGADGQVPGPPQPVAVGDVVWGIWGHRTEAVLDAAALAGHQLPPGLDPVVGCFVRVGAIALNAVLAAHAALGTTVVVVGQGVIGLLATRLAVLSGATVVAVDALPRRREEAAALGAHHVLSPHPDLPVQVRDRTATTGADAAIELSGTYPGLQSATRLVGPDGIVVAAGFYQGAGSLRLGEEFHHNRVQVLASQIGSVPTALRARWDVARLQRTVVRLLAAGDPDVSALVTHRFPLAEAARAYEMLDTAGGDALQVVLDMR
ncbi:zinc-binding alcohol dehydrogenase [Georgenia sp. TF02-10]|uniref:zinc-dependent alcohol dehydrogenase n=1 Tax=Georgenia sp. TF02-10 TaxID=2917725 RepID=UPI001FA7C30B|nr:zinc-binding alcohol dehydrogenase [Georgenia sp. TF02-10]UNX55683.1 zinc-binding alcohol dehydrogenase [Georgenia sp. TF02-10]